MSDNSRLIQVKVIELIKTSSRNPIVLSSEANTFYDYICLGHFDAISIRDVCAEEDNAFKKILKDYHNMGNPMYFYSNSYPLYILHSFCSESDQKRMDEYWKSSFPFMLISRVHPKMNKDESFDLKSFISNNNTVPKNTLGDISVIVNNEYVHCAFFYTLELGDVVAVLKSNSLVSCLELARLIMTYESVGDIYSYCALNIELFTNEGAVQGTVGADKKTIQIGKYSIQGIDNALQESVYAAVRFSIKSSFYATKFCDNLKEFVGAQFVTGTADLQITWNEIKIQNIIVFLKKLLIEYEETLIDEFDQQRILKYCMYDAFDDIVTRIGVTYEGRSNNDITKNVIISSNSQDRIVRNNKLIDYCLSLVKESPLEWTVALYVQYHNLVTMTNDCVMDDLSLLLWPSVEAFLERLKAVIEGEKIDEKENVHDICVFLEKWSSLSNDIFHLESQLLQNPEVQTPRVYAPATLFAFYMAVLDTFNQMFQRIDILFESDRKSSEYIPLIAHDFGIRTNTLCIMDPFLNGKNSYSKRCPILVSIPINMMYSPNETIAVLCHEMAHYTGEAMRNRRKRYEYIHKSCIGLICYMWHLEELNYDEAEMEEVESYISHRIEELLCDTDTSYIHLLRDKLPTVFKEIFLSWEDHSAVLRMNTNKELPLIFYDYIQQFSSLNLYNSYNVICSHMNTLLLLYRECYADIIAILSLGITKEEYCVSMFEKEFEYNCALKSGDLEAEILCFQSAVVCTAIEKVVDGNFSKIKNDSSKWVTQWIEKMDTYKTQIEKGDNIVFQRVSDEGARPEILFKFIEYYPLLNYLTECAQQMNLAFCKKDISALRYSLQSMLNVVSDGNISLEEIRKIIYSYNKKTWNSEADEQKLEETV